MSIAVGTRFGPCEILEPLGAGGMGEVYRARDPRLSRDVAVKPITTDGTPSADRVRRFEIEARAAAQLAHPNVVTVHDVGTHDGHPYLVRELLEWETLRETPLPGVGDGAGLVTRIEAPGLQVLLEATRSGTSRLRDDLRFVGPGIQ